MIGQHCRHRLLRGLNRRYQTRFILPVVCVQFVVISLELCVFFCWEVWVFFRRVFSLTLGEHRNVGREINECETTISLISIWTEIRVLEIIVSVGTLNHFFVRLPASLALETFFFELYGFELGLPMFLMEKHQLSDQKHQLSTQIPPKKTFILMSSRKRTFKCGLYIRHTE